MAWTGSLLEHLLTGCGLEFGGAEIAQGAVIRALALRPAGRVTWQLSRIVASTGSAPPAAHICGCAVHLTSWRSAPASLCLDTAVSGKKNAARARARLDASVRCPARRSRIPAHLVRRDLARLGADPGVQVRHRPDDRRWHRARGRGPAAYHRHALGSLRLAVGRRMRRTRCRPPWLLEIFAAEPNHTATSSSPPIRCQSFVV